MRQLRKADPPLGGEIAAGGARDPEVQVAVVVEQIAIAVPEPIREAAANGQTAELRVEALAIEDEDRAVLEEVEAALNPVRAMGLEFLGFDRPLGLERLGAGRGCALGLRDCGLGLGLRGGWRRGEERGDKPERDGSGSGVKRDHENQPILPRLGPRWIALALVFDASDRHRLAAGDTISGERLQRADSLTTMTPRPPCLSASVKSQSFRIGRRAPEVILGWDYSGRIRGLAPTCSYQKPSDGRSIRRTYRLRASRRAGLPATTMVSPGLSV